MTEEVMSPNGGIKHPPLISSFNSNLATSHRQKCLCGSFNIRVEDCETPVESETKESCFEKRERALHPGS